MKNLTRLTPLLLSRSSAFHAPLLAMAVGWCCGLSPALNAAMIARWDFNTGTSADLISNVGGYAFTETGTGGSQTTTYQPGSISLGTGRELVATGVNSTNLADLKQNTTIWARLRFDSAGTSDSFYLGLLQGTTPVASPQTYSSMTLTARHNGSKGEGAYGNLSSGSALSTGDGSLAPTPGIGEWFSIALVFESGVTPSGNPSLTHSTVILYINGVAVSAVQNTGLSLQDFDAFALGRLNASGAAGRLTFDSVHIYDTALTASEIAAIPEPGMTGLVASALLAFSGVAFSRQRRQARGEAH